MGSEELSQLVEQLSKGLRRILRKYRTLHSHLQARQESAGVRGHQHQQPQQQPWQQQQQAYWPQDEEASSSGGGCGSGASQGSGGGSWEIGAAAGRSVGTAGGCGGSASQAMAEAGRKAASIAEKLNRLLTPQSRAAVHGGAGAGGLSRFSAEAGSGGQHEEEEEEEEEGGVWDAYQQQHGQQQYSQQLWPLGAASAADPRDDIPLRQRFGGGRSYTSDLAALL